MYGVQNGCADSDPVRESAQMYSSPSDHFPRYAKDEFIPSCTVRLQSDGVVHGILKSRFATQRASGCFSESVLGPELNLLQFAFRLMAKGLGVDDTRTFANGDGLAGVDIGETRDRAAGPVNFNHIGFGGRAKAKGENQFAR